MTTTHTPGPWAFRDCTLVQDTGNRLHLGVFRESPGLGSAAAGNARLIAAAPDLLAALREIVDHFQRTGDPTLGDMAPRARAAIARATGA